MFVWRESARGIWGVARAVDDTAIEIGLRRTRDVPRDAIVVAPTKNKRFRHALGDDASGLDDTACAAVWRASGGGGARRKIVFSERPRSPDEKISASCVTASGREYAERELAFSGTETRLAVARHIASLSDAERDDLVRTFHEAEIEAMRPAVEYARKVDASRVFPETVRCVWDVERGKPALETVLERWTTLPPGFCVVRRTGAKVLVTSEILEGFPPRAEEALELELCYALSFTV